MNSKICSKCKVEKSLIEFSRDKKTNSGLQAWCKICLKEYRRQYNISNFEKLKEYSRQYNINNFEKEKARSKRYYINNIEKVKIRQKEYTKNNAEKIRVYQKQWSINNPEKEKEKVRRWQANNPEKVKDCKRVWRINNPERGRDYNGRRRALLENCISEKVDLKQLYENHKWICGICGKKIDKKFKYPNLKSISLDHIIPLSKGGSHTYDNIQPAHFVCNLRKNNKIDNIQLRLQTA